MSPRLSLQRPAARLRALGPRRASSTFAQAPAPPKLPAAQQAEFERLQHSAAVSSAFQPAATSAASPAPPATQQPRHATDAARPAEHGSRGDDDEAPRGLFRGAPPEFKGDVNPKTGEVGGPKNEPLRWGGGGDWSYNGRVTDF